MRNLASAAVQGRASRLKELERENPELRRPNEIKRCIAEAHSPNSFNAFPAACRTRGSGWESSGCT
jgi:hypothetical protein